MHNGSHPYLSAPLFIYHTTRIDIFYVSCGHCIQRSGPVVWAEKDGTGTEDNDVMGRTVQF